MIDEETHASALKATLSATFTAADLTDVQALDRDEAADVTTLPPDYALLDLEVRFAETRMMCGDPATTPWRTTIETVAITVTNARVIRTAIRQAFTGLTVADQFAKPELESSSRISQDKQGRWVCEDVFIYSLDN